MDYKKSRICIKLLNILYTSLFSFLFLHSNLSSSEIKNTIFCPETNIKISLPDFEYSEKIDKESSQVFTHREYSFLSLIFTKDDFSNETFLSVSNYAKNFTRKWKSDDPSIKKVLEKKFFSGKNCSFPMLYEEWKNTNSTIYLLYFVKKNYGYCLWVISSPPEGTEKSTVVSVDFFWREFMNDLPKFIEVTK